MLTGSIIVRASDAQKHGAQSEVMQRSTSPMGVFTRAAPTLVQNEERFTAAHASRPVGEVPNAKLTASARKHIAPKNFALPGGRYPINDANHARNALARVSQNGTAAQKAAVRAKVHHKFPGIGG